MSTPVGSSQWMYTPASGFYPYLIDQSLRFPNTDSGTGNAYLNRTPSSASNRRTWTYSAWVKRSKLGNGGANQSQLIWAAFDGGDADQFQFGDTNNLRFYLNDATNANIQTTAVYRDVSSWYHIVLAVDTTQATASDRVSIYVNGEEVTDLSSSTYPTQNYQTDWNSNVAHTIGQSARINNTQFFCGYMAEVNFIDGTVLDPTSFGETINGVWVPKAYSGSYGTNGFYLSFADSAAIGDDLSGNTNDWTANNLAASDVVPDSPTNNWCTFNPLDQNDVTGLTYPTTYSEGNLKVTQGTGFINRKATFGMTGGKWYWEIKINDSSPDSFFGVSKSTGDARGALDNDEATIRLTNGNLYTNGAESSYGTAFSNGDVCILAVDMDAGKFWAGRNGTWFASGDPAAGTNEGKSGLASELFPSVSLADAENCDVNFGQNGTFNGTKTAGGNSDGNGYGDFLYTVPSGFFALNSANLPEPTIGPNSTTTSDQHFDTALWTADVTNPASGDKSISLLFQPDLVWSKNRDNAEHHYWMDSVRGDNDGSKWLKSNSTAAEGADAIGSTTAKYDFTSTGFDIIDTDSTSGEVYYSPTSRTYVGWCWKAGGTAVSNTDGSITSSVSANQDAGFSICTYTGTATVSESFGHGLNQAPELVITKARSVGNAWRVHGSVLGTDKFLALNGTGSVGTDSTNGGFPDNTDTVVNVGYESETGVDFVAYCFHSVPGYSSVGSYVGNGSADGTFVYTGFRPAWLMVKRTGSGGWHMFDNKRAFAGNEIDVRLEADNSDAENTGGPPHMDFLSSGFKMRTSFDNMNASGNTYIYLAFAEMPFKYANAR